MGITNKYTLENSQSLIKSAYFNSVTELPNLSNIELVISEQIDRARRHNKKFILTAMKVNNYADIKSESKEKADTYMHEAANRLLTLVRDEDIVGHIEEDVFLIVFNEYLEDGNYSKITERIESVFIGDPHLHTDGNIDFQVTLGCSEYPDHGVNVHSLIEHAKSAALK